MMQRQYITLGPRCDQNSPFHHTSISKKGLHMINLEVSRSLLLLHKELELRRLIDVLNIQRPLYVKRYQLDLYAHRRRKLKNLKVSIPVKSYCEQYKSM